jgi:hypothetical protein
MTRTANQLETERLIMRRFTPEVAAELTAAAAALR